MIPRPEFRVIIVGGGIAGLVLANQLQHAGIDFILLERRDIIDPQVGASIGIAPQGLRILDQLGCWEDVDNLIEPLVTGSEIWEDGSEIIPPTDTWMLLKKR
jgi:2-polyprenyl-6-methoxyphenol hydroxylase-like FAD-dependent oxidoreductase